MFGGSPSPINVGGMFGGGLGGGGGGGSGGNRHPLDAYDLAMGGRSGNGLYGANMFGLNPLHSARGGNEQETGRFGGNHPLALGNPHGFGMFGQNRWPFGPYGQQQGTPDNSNSNSNTNNNSNSGSGGGGSNNMAPNSSNANTTNQTSGGPPRGLVDGGEQQHSQNTTAAVGAQQPNITNVNFGDNHRVQRSASVPRSATFAGGRPYVDELITPRRLLEGDMPHDMARQLGTATDNTNHPTAATPTPTGGLGGYMAGLTSPTQHRLGSPLTLPGGPGGAGSPTPAAPVQGIGNSGLGQAGGPANAAFANLPTSTYVVPPTQGNQPSNSALNASRDSAYESAGNISLTSSTNSTGQALTSPRPTNPPTSNLSSQLATLSSVPSMQLGGTGGTRSSNPISTIGSDGKSVNSSPVNMPSPAPPVEDRSGGERPQVCVSPEGIQLPADFRLPPAPPKNRANSSVSPITIPKDSPPIGSSSGNAPLSSRGEPSSHNITNTTTTTTTQPSIARRNTTPASTLATACSAAPPPLQPLAPKSSSPTHTRPTPSAYDKPQTTTGGVNTSSWPPSSLGPPKSTTTSTPMASISVDRGMPTSPPYQPLQSFNMTSPPGRVLSSTPPQPSQPTGGLPTPSASALRTIQTPTTAVRHSSVGDYSGAHHFQHMGTPANILPRTTPTSPTITHVSPAPPPKFLQTTDMSPIPRLGGDERSGGGGYGGGMRGTHITPPPGPLALNVLHHPTSPAPGDLGRPIPPITLMGQQQQSMMVDPVRHLSPHQGRSGVSPVVGTSPIGAPSLAIAGGAQRGGPPARPPSGGLISSPAPPLAQPGQPQSSNSRPTTQNSPPAGGGVSLSLSSAPASTLQDPGAASRIVHTNTVPAASLSHRPSTTPSAATPMGMSSPRQPSTPSQLKKMITPQSTTTPEVTTPTSAKSPGSRDTTSSSTVTPTTTGSSGTNTATGINTSSESAFTPTSPNAGPKRAAGRPIGGTATSAFYPPGSREAPPGKRNSGGPQNNWGTSF